MGRPKKTPESSNPVSDAARVLQAQGQANKLEPTPEPKIEKVLDVEHMSRALRNRPSAQAMDEIFDKREPKVEPEPEVVEEKKVEAPKEEPKVEATPEVEPKAETAPPVVEAPKMVKVKIDGEESEVTQEEIDDYGSVRAYQTAKAADKRLQKTNELLAEIRKAQSESAPKAPAAPTVTDQQYIAERIEKVRFGTPEEAVTAQLEINQRLNKQVDPQAMAFQIEQQIANKQAVAKFREEFSDIANNPILWDAAIALEGRKSVAWKQAGKPVDWIVEYRKIGNEVRSAFGRQSQPTAQTDKTGTPSQSEKEAKKAAAVVALPTSGSRAALPQEEKEPTAEDERASWFKETKKVRGQ